MKQLFISLSILIACLTSCDYEYTVFQEPTEYLTAPSSVTNITSEALPGQILLKWDVPADSNFYFLRIKYYDPRKKEDVSQIVSAYVDTLLIDETRARYGEYDFSFQTFNSYDEGSTVQTLKAYSDNAPATETIFQTKINLIAEQLSTNAQEPSEGPIANLLDGNPNTMFHTSWSSYIAMPHYIDVHFYEEHQQFQFYYQNRNGSQDAPTNIDLFTSKDGTSWDHLANITAGLPAGAGAEYTSAVYKAAEPFTYFRFQVNAAERNGSSSNYFNLAQFIMYDVEINIYDPETDEEE